MHISIADQEGGNGTSILCIDRHASVSRIIKLTNPEHLEMLAGFAKMLGAPNVSVGSDIVERLELSLPSEWAPATTTTYIRSFT